MSMPNYQEIEQLTLLFYRTVRKKAGRPTTNLL